MSAVVLTLTLTAGLVGYLWGAAAGSATREVSGVVDNANDHAIFLTGVDGEEDGEIAAALVVDPEVAFGPGDTVRGVLIDMDGADGIDVFVLREVLPTAR